jgi:outer membrane protease
MKKALVLLALLITARFSISAQSNVHKLSLGTSAGLLMGRSEEIVYRNASTKNKASQLLWYFKPMVYAGVDLHYNSQFPQQKWNIFADGIFKFGFPGKMGQMEDRDWIDEQRIDLLTHYSVHNNNTERAILIDTDIGVSFTLFKTYLLKAFVSYSFMNFSWTGSGGSILYPASDGGHGYAPSGAAISYEQTWNILSPGVSFYGAFNRYFDMEVSFKLSPLIWLSATDHHFFTTAVYNDDGNGGFYFEPNILFSFRANSFINVGLSFSYKNISGTRGDDKIAYQGQNYTAKNMAGGGYSAFDVGLTTKFKIFR